MSKEQNDNPRYIASDKARVQHPEKGGPYKLPDDIREAERVEINKRRENFELDRIPGSDGNGGSDNQGGSIAPVDRGGSSGNGERAVADIHESLVGLALSGGGIRSATFSLGVMQALAKNDLMKYVDILSTVSGGGYIGASLTWLTSGQAGSVQAASVQAGSDQVDSDQSHGGQANRARFGAWGLSQWALRGFRKPRLPGAGRMFLPGISNKRPPPVTLTDRARLYGVGAIFVVIAGTIS